ncbi:hypothetical protein Bbelb_166660 [Branchiostoma belcheri]|nr:hypothetical protein Bbelb_166660 [Branchiostoma belcheri]
MPEIVESDLKLFADDTKIFRPVKFVESCTVLQNDLQKLQEWARKWQLCFHPSKCTVIRLGKGHPNFSYTMVDSSIDIPLVYSQHEKDLGITVDEELNFCKHILAITSKANQMAGLMWRTFEFIDREVFLLLYKSLIRPHLEYGVSVWSPHTWKLAVELEKVQKRATKRVPGLRDLPYTERLKALGLPTLVYRRLRGDLINTYKFIHGKFNTVSPFELKSDSRTRGHCLRVARRTAHGNKRACFFANRMVVWWNNLPEKVVTSPSVNAFKERLDLHMKGRNLMFDYRALDHPQRPEMSVH